MEPLIFIRTGTITELTSHQPAASTHPIINKTKEAEPVARVLIGVVWLFNQNGPAALSQRDVINIYQHQMTDGTEREDDTLSSGSELITPCSGSDTQVYCGKREGI